MVLAEETLYFMLIMDSILSFWYVKFLKEKNVEIALEVLKNFMTEIERLTKQKLMRVRVYYKQE